MGRIGIPLLMGCFGPVGLDFRPVTGQLYATVNERDGLGDNLVPDFLPGLDKGNFSDGLMLIWLRNMWIRVGWRTEKAIARSWSVRLKGRHCCFSPIRRPWGCNFPIAAPFGQNIAMAHLWRFGAVGIAIAVRVIKLSSFLSMTRELQKATMRTF